MRIPRAKDHVAGKYQVAVFVRTPDGSTASFSSTHPLEPDHPIVVHANRAVAAALGIRVKEPG
jgi:hypothetical protein